MHIATMLMPLASHILLALCLALGLSQSSTRALKIGVTIPELVKLNDAFWLNCSHKPQRSHSQPTQEGNSMAAIEDIYAIKWYKDEEEFYRFLPNAEPKVSIYETNGIQLDQAKSREGNVFVSKADIHSEGNYRCEIVSEAPVFETVRKSKHLKVYALPVRGPRIEILDANGRPKSPKAQEISYAVGDKIELRCNSAPSKPAARLRWYLNDHELTMPNSNSNNSNTNNSATSHQLERHGRLVSQLAALGYDVRVTPVEYRQHYKGIYSSHSSLSLILQQDDLVNSKISFKCLASIRQDVQIQSKNLIVLTPQPQAPSSNSRLRAKRLSGTQFITADNSDSDTHVQHRHRAQYNRHGISRLPQSSPRSQTQPKSSLSSDLISSLLEDSRNQIMYIYEDSDSTLGPSIVNGPDTLESYLRQSINDTDSTATNSNYALEFNRADNLEYVQMLRERLSRQRSFPSSQSGVTGTNTLGQRRPFGPNSLVKSPLYLDENDSLRPIINWPPLNSGKLMLLPPGNSIVAIPTQSNNNKFSSDTTNELKFVLPPRQDSIDTPFQVKNLLIEKESQIGQILLERLIHNMNCTCTEGSIDSKLSWSVNDVPLNSRDIKLFPTRVSPDHRQTWTTIGLQTPTSHSTSGTSLRSILSQYYKTSELYTPSKSMQLSSSIDARVNVLGNSPSAGNDQIRFMCHATHSMLLYSSSEMITFDFNLPPNSPVDGNSIDKYPSPTNVIQATSASQSSSSSGLMDHVTSSRSQAAITLTMSFLFIYKWLVVPRIILVDSTFTFNKRDR